jgi:Zn-finger protein
MVDTINYACKYYPCHEKDKLESCVFCYCFRYPCEDTSLGKYLENGIWDCSKCVWPHNKKRVDNIFGFLERWYL